MTKNAYKRYYLKDAGAETEIPDHGRPKCNYEDSEGHTFVCGSPSAQCVGLVYLW
jgi:hypothetical protein